MSQAIDPIRRNTHIMLIAVIGNVVAVYAFNIGLARLLLPQDYGNYKVAESFFNLASIGVLLGGAPAALRFLPALIQSKNRSVIWAYIRFYLAIAIVASLLLAVITLAVMQYLFPPDSTANMHPIIYALIVIPAVSLTALVASVLQSAQRVDLAFLPLWVGFPALKLTLIVVFAAIAGSISANAAVMMAFLAMLLILSFQTFKARQLGLLVLKRASESIQATSWLKVSVPMMLLVALQTAFNQVDIYMIEIFGAEAEVGHFAVASTTTLILFAIQLAIMGVFEPLMAPALRDGDHAVRALNAQCFRRLIMFSVPVFLLAIIFPQTILSVFGSKYTDSIDALRFLLPGYLVSTMLASSYAWLQYSGYERKAAMIMLAGVAVNIVLDFILIPHYGIEGAAAATSAVFVGIYIGFCTLMRKYLGIFPWSRPMKLSPSGEGRLTSGVE